MPNKDDKNINKIDDSVKNEDLDLDNLDNELNEFDDLENFDIESFGKDDRKPIVQAASGFTEGVKNSLSADLAFRTIEKSIPTKYGSLKSSVQVTQEAFNTLSSIKNELQKDLSDTTRSIKTFTRKSLPFVKKVLPSKFAKKLDEWSTPEEERERLSQEESRNQQIRDSLKSLFDEQNALEAEKIKIETSEKLLQQQYQKYRDSKQLTLLAQIKFLLKKDYIFNQLYLKNYVTKSLELKYKSLFILKDIFEVTKHLGATVDEKLTKVVHNTGLPDIVKTTRMEVFKERLRSGIYGQLSDRIRNFGTELIKNIKESVVTKSKEILSGIKETTEGIGSLLDTTSSMGDMVSKYEMAGDVIGSTATSFLPSILGKVLRKRLSEESLQALDEKAKYLFLSSPIKLRNKLKEYEEKGGVISSLAESLSSAVEKSLYSEKNLYSTTLEEPTAPVSWDVLSRKTLVEIIPTYLSEISRNTESLIKGKIVSRKVYDVEKSKFVDESEIKSNLLNKIGYKQEDVKSKYEKVINTISKRYIQHGGNVDFLKNNIDDLVKFSISFSKEADKVTIDDIIKYLDNKTVPNQYEVENVLKNIKNIESIKDILFTSYYTDKTKRYVSDKFRTELTQSIIELIDYRNKIIENVYKNIQEQHKHLFQDWISDTTKLEKELLEKNLENIQLNEKELQYIVPLEKNKEVTLNELIDRNEKLQNTLKNIEKKKSNIKSELRKKKEKAKFEYNYKKDILKTHLEDIKDNLQNKIQKSEKIQNITKSTKSIKDQIVNRIVKSKKEPTEVSTPVVKDEPHISGPGTYVQGSPVEAHIPLDIDFNSLKQSITNLTNVISNQKDKFTKIKESVTDKIPKDINLKNIELLNKLNTNVSKLINLNAINLKLSHKDINVDSILNKIKVPNVIKNINLKKSIETKISQSKELVSKYIPKSKQDLNRKKEELKFNLLYNLDMGKAHAQDIIDKSSQYVPENIKEKITNISNITKTKTSNIYNTLKNQLIQKQESLKEQETEDKSLILLNKIHERLDAILNTNILSLKSTTSNDESGIINKTLNRFIISPKDKISNYISKLKLPNIKDKIDKSTIIGGLLSGLLSASGALGKGYLKYASWYYSSLFKAGKFTVSGLSNLSLKILKGLFKREDKEEKEKGILGKAKDKIKSGVSWVGKKTLGAAKSLGKLGLSALGAGASVLMSGIGTIGSGLATAGSFLLTNPVGWAILGTAAAGAGAYWLYKKFHKTKEQKALLNVRCQYYGCSMKQKDVIEDLEKDTIKNLDKGDIFSKDDIKDYVKDFGLDPKDKDQVKYWLTWYKDRFLPILKIFRSVLLQTTKKDFNDIKDLSKEEAGKVIFIFRNRAIDIARKYSDLVPTQQGYMKIKKKKEEAKKSGKTFTYGKETKKEAEQRERRQEILTGKGRVSKAEDMPENIDELLLVEYEDKKEVKTLFGKILTGVSLLSPAGLAFTLGRKIVGWFTKLSKEEKILINMRMLAYGIKTMEHYKSTLDLEKIMLDKIEHNKPLEKDEIDVVASQFGFNIENKEELDYFVTWLRHRFYPIFKLFLKLLESQNKSYDEQDELSIKQIKYIYKYFKKYITNVLNKYGTIYPSKKLYLQYKKQKEKKSTKKKKEALTSKAKSSPTQTEVTEKTNEATKKTTIESKKAITQKSKTESPNTPSPAVAQATQLTTQASNIISTSIPEQPTTPSEYTTVTSPIASTRSTAPIYTGEEIGSLSARYESGNRGSEAVGWDRVGGTSYGKYQIATRTGTFKRFLNYCKTKGGMIGKEVYERLTKAGNPDGGKNGPVAIEWRKLAREGKIQDLEYNFIKETHYIQTLKYLNPEVRRIMTSKKILKDVVWSTAVQHGPRGAARIINQAYNISGNDEYKLVQNIYNIRSTKFRHSSPRVRNSIINRYKHEVSTVLANLKTTTPKITQVAESQSEKTEYEQPQSKYTQVAKAEISTPVIKDEPHISGPGMYIQKSPMEAHIPLDMDVDSIKQSITNLTLSIFDDKDTITKIHNKLTSPFESKNITDNSIISKSLPINLQKNDLTQPFNNQSELLDVEISQLKTLEYISKILENVYSEIQNTSSKSNEVSENNQYSNHIIDILQNMKEVISNMSRLSNTSTNMRGTIDLTNEYAQPSNESLVSISKANLNRI